MQTIVYLAENKNGELEEPRTRGYTDYNVPSTFGNVRLLFFPFSFG